MKKTKYPMVLEDGGASVKIRERSDHGHPSYRIEYYSGGVRKIVDRADEKEALSDARRALAMLAERAPVFVDSADGAEFKAARHALGGVGVPVDVAAREYAVALSGLGGASLADAVAAFRKFAPRRTDKLVPVLVEEYLAGMKGDVSKPYFARIRDRLRRFAAGFKEAKIHELNKEDMEKWIRGLSLGNRARNNERDALIGLSNWAKSMGYLPEDRIAEAQRIKKLDAPTTIGIFPVATVAKLMAALRDEKPKLVPYAAMGLFAGVRPLELTRLRFEKAIRWEHSDIEIEAKDSKTGFRRLTELMPNLAAWMADYRDKNGLIASGKAYRELSAFAKSKGIAWSPDVMRHSFISYAVALTESVGKVALWAGNSEAIIKKHYLERVLKKEAEAFFAILPMARAA
jgi:integrase